MSAVVALVGVFLLVFFILSMARRNVGFKIGYFLYSRTPIGRLYFLRELRQAAVKFPVAHSEAEVTAVNDVNILPIPFSNDNFAYMVWRSGAESCVLIDPGHASPVLTALQKFNLRPSSVLVTHKHWDHAYGAEKIRRRYSNVAVYGSSGDSASGVTQALNGDSEIIVDSNLRFRAIFTPGHTVGHMAYVLVTSQGQHCLFSGDALFLGGVGRMFEGTAAMFTESLEKLCALPPETLLFPGHEYAVDNLKFVTFIDPENERASKKLEWAIERRSLQQPTCPSSMAEELSYNPYLKIEARMDMWTEILGLPSDAPAPLSERREQIFLELRRRKDAFKFII